MNAAYFPPPAEEYTELWGLTAERFTQPLQAQPQPVAICTRAPRPQPGNLPEPPTPPALGHAGSATAWRYASAVLYRF